MAKQPLPADPSGLKYIERTRDMLREERERYLRQRRAANGLPEPTEDNLTGLCISGGGVRSATLGLGMFQALIKARLLRHVDYLSTVSGGGYIGSCLSSLLSAEPENVDKARQIPNRNKRFNTADLGVDAENSPFVALRTEYEYKQLKDTELSAKHQLHHLRRRGEYLTPNKRLLGWDVGRAVGALLGGMVMNFVLFLLLIATAVLLHHNLFAVMSEEQFFQHLRHPEVLLNQEVAESRNAAEQGVAGPGFYQSWESIPAEEWAKMSISEQLGAWYTHKLLPQFALIGMGMRAQWWAGLLFAGLGFLVGWLFLLYARRLPHTIAWQEQEEQRYAQEEQGRYYDRPGGDDMARFVSIYFVRTFAFTALIFGPLMAYGVAIAGRFFRFFPEGDYFVMLGLPLCFSLGLFVSVNVLINLFYLSRAKERVSGRLYRSFYTGMQGVSFTGLMASLLFPVAIILLFGDHGLAVTMTVSFLPVAAAYYFAMQGLSGNGGGNSLLNKVIRAIQMPLLNLSIFLFVGLAFAALSNLIYALEQALSSPHDGSFTWVTLSLLGGVALLTAILGFAVDSNDISLHYFYRDRLSEAYLRTDGRVARPDEPLPETGPLRVRPKELFDVNLRNHDDLKLKDLGEGNFRGPYHIIVSALNLQGSNDLARKTLKSDHFIFSKYFIGSRTTGYYRTEKYRGGSTKLSMAMAVSAAAVASGMGLLSFAASNFYLTLFNLRTGYWVENPWYLHKEDQEEALEQSGRRIKRTLMERLTKMVRRYPFWLYYLWLEFTGKLNSRTRRVYVSDGGHTGDNLGLLPLIQRRCKTIIIADFEEDGKFSFGSFGQAVRLARAIYDAEIEIDIRPLMPQKSEEGLLFSPASTATGTIRYANGTIGRIIYMKSSVSLLKEVSNLDATDAPPPGKEPAPVFVLNYFKNNPAFPHQSTADQYFDEVQFEAYRMLGEHISRQAVEEIQLAVGSGQ